MKKGHFLTGILLCLGCFVYAQNSNITKLSNFKYPSGNISSLWGYTAPNNKEYAIVGAKNYMSIVDVSNPTTPVELFKVPCSSSEWHEIKTYSHYVYMVSDNTGDGLKIVDLQYLPDSIKSYNWFGSGNFQFTTAHTLWIDSKGFLYLNGGQKKLNNNSLRGTTIHNLNPDPIHPSYVGSYSPRYVHDCYVKGDTMFVAEINDGYFSVVDIRNRSSPIKITEQKTPLSFTHNAWTSNDGRTIYTTDEVTGSAVGVYDISDLSDIKLLDQFKNPTNNQAIIHNVHAIGDDFIIMSYYRDGVVIADAKYPTSVVKMGRYDTNPLSGNGFNGCWEVYPYLKSGNLLAADMEQGLFVLKPNYLGACFISGTVKDSTTGFPLNNVKIQIVNRNVAFSDIDGSYNKGFGNPGTTTVKFTKQGYKTVNVNNVIFNRRQPLTFNIAMLPNNPLTDDQKSVQNSEISIINNPVNNLLWLNIPSNESEVELQYIITDVMGKEIRKGCIYEQGRVSIDGLQVLSIGTYFIGITENGASEFTGIFIKD